MKSNSYEVVFIYSEMECNDETAIAARLGKAYKPGTIYSGRIYKNYTSMIRPEQLDFMKSQYPDMKIIERGPKNSFIITPPKKEFA